MLCVFALHPSHELLQTDINIFCIKSKIRFGVHDSALFCRILSFFSSLTRCTSRADLGGASPSGGYTIYEVCIPRKLERAFDKKYENGDKIIH